MISITLVCGDTAYFLTFKPIEMQVQNSYRIKKEAALGTKTPTPKQKEIRPRPPQNPGLVISQETVEAAAKTAAYQIAEAENKSVVAAEAMKEAERVARMAEDSESLLQLVKEIYEQCKAVDTSLFGSIFSISFAT